MKKQAAKRRKISDVRKMRIVDTIVNFLDANSADFIVRKYSKFLAVHPDIASEDFLEQLLTCNDLLDVQPENLEKEQQESFEVFDFHGYNVKDEMGQDMSHFITEHDGLDMVEQQTEEYEINEFEVMETEEMSQNEVELVPKIEDEDTMVEDSMVVGISSVVVQKAKKYQRQSLDPKQREWIRKKIKKCEIPLQTSFGPRNQWCCDICTSFKCFNTENAFRLHLKGHLEDFTIEKTIEGSDDQFTRIKVTAEDQSIIEQRMWIRDQIQSQREFILTNEGAKATWSCSQCDYVTHKRDRFRVHLQKVHTTIVLRGPSKHSCLECRLRFDGENHLVVHKNCHRIFDVIAPYAMYPECSACKMLFVSNEDLQMHLERHKDQPENLQEPIVAVGVIFRNGETFVDDSIDKDQSDLFDENALTCGHCLLKFASEEECKQHLMLFHATSFVCPFDLRVFDGIPTLSFGNHLRHFHPEIFPDLEITCSFCKMQFDTVYEKLAHMKNCKAKKFHCDHCDKSFFRKAELIHHLKVVTGLMVFAW